MGQKHAFEGPRCLGRRSCGCSRSGMRSQVIVVESVVARPAIFPGGGGVRRGRLLLEIKDRRELMEKSMGRRMDGGL